jgi:hypothetical protein
MRGVVVFNNGGDDQTNLGEGPTLYTQNLAGSEIKYISGVFVHGYRYTIIQLFSTNGQVSNYEVDGFIGIGGNHNQSSLRFLCGTNSIAMEGVGLKRLYLWDCSLFQGVRTGKGRDHQMSITDSYVVNNHGAALVTNDAIDLTIKNNTFISQSTDLIDAIDQFQEEGAVFDVDQNTYHHTQGFATIDGVNGNATFAEWQAWRGFDANSSASNNLPTANVIHLLDWQALDCQHLGAFDIYNWERLSSVNVDLATLTLPAGDYELRQGQDYFGDVRTFSYDPEVSTIISVDMSEASVAVPINAEEPLRSSTFPDFGAFVLRVVT